MIVVTGAAGFIGGYVARFLNSVGREDLILVDDFNDELKRNRTLDIKCVWGIQRESFFSWLEKNFQTVSTVIHLGARTDTMSEDKLIMDLLNFEYSKAIWQFCSEMKIPLVYASSAATYGDGSLGYEDSHSKIHALKPLNLYAQSKQQFDVFALESNSDFKWYGLKFFNVYGPGESHKGRMASVIHHAKNQILLEGKVSLYKSYDSRFKDGEQLRDFIYVGDVAKTIHWLLLELPESGIYNLGTGKARTFIDLVKGVFSAMKVQENIEFVDMPDSLVSKYQYFTEADMEKLKKAGCNLKFYSLEEGISDYLKIVL